MAATERKAAVTGQQLEPTPPSSTFNGRRCTLCRVRCCGAKNEASHAEGAKHLKRCRTGLFGCPGARWTLVPWHAGYALRAHSGEYVRITPEDRVELVAELRDEDERGMCFQLHEYQKL